MADIIVRRLDDAVKERLRQRAKRHGRSLEAEVREILEAATAPDPSDNEDSNREGFGTRLHKRVTKVGLTPDEARVLNQAVDELRRGSKPRDPGIGR